MKKSGQNKPEASPVEGATTPVDCGDDTAQISQPAPGEAASLGRLSAIGRARLEAHGLEGFDLAPHWTIGDDGDPSELLRAHDEAQAALADAAAKDRRAADDLATAQAQKADAVRAFEDAETPAAFEVLSRASVEVERCTLIATKAQARRSELAAAAAGPAEALQRALDRRILRALLATSGPAVLGEQVERHARAIAEAHAELAARIEAMKSRSTVLGHLASKAVEIAATVDPSSTPAPTPTLVDRVEALARVVARRNGTDPVADLYGDDQDVKSWFNPNAGRDLYAPNEKSRNGARRHREADLEIGNLEGGAGYRFELAGAVIELRDVSAVNREREAAEAAEAFRAKRRAELAETFKSYAYGRMRLALAAKDQTWDEVNRKAKLSSDPNVRRRARESADEAAELAQLEILAADYPADLEAQFLEAQFVPDDLGKARAAAELAKLRAWLEQEKKPGGALRAS